MYRHAAVALFIALSLAACGGVTDPSQNTKETITGTISPPGNGSSFSANFNVAKTGELTIAVTAMTPGIPTSTFFTVGYGLASSSGCQPLQVNQFSTVATAALSGIAITPGGYCVFVIDEGLFTTSETFTISVSHP
jgi:hypothetical protein